MSEISSQHRQLPPYHEIHRSIFWSIVLVIITFGLFYFYWQYKQMQAWNRLLGQNRYSFILWFLLSLITLGLYHIYHEYRMGADMLEIQQMYGKPLNTALPVISVILAILAFPIISDAMQQHELHRLYNPQYSQSNAQTV